MSQIVTPAQIQNALDANPAEILRAIHKRIVDTEKLIGEYRNFAMNQQTDIEMLQERVTELTATVNKLTEEPKIVKNEFQTELFDIA